MSHTSVPRGSAAWLWCLGIISLIGSTIVADTTMGWDDVWVIGQWVPRRSNAVGALTGVGLLLLIAGTRWRIVLTRRGALPRSRHWVRVAGARVLTALVLIVALPLTVFVAWLDGWDAFHVLHPVSADGCRIVVEESDSFDGDGTITVYVAPAGEYRARRVGYRGSDSRLFGADRYELTWHGESAGLRLPAGSATGPWSCSG
ncbi:hypothetical protein [Kineococcus sp. SYSU DK005]|uniref:hypothetical protein n=1 Tax=Kineococcus sp. SYSU DK005 TaxID=3383126 RepID=UPI003D7F151B